MASEERSLAMRGDLARAGAPGGDPLAAARARLDAALAEVTALDAEVEALAASLAAFAAALEARVGPLDAEARRAAGAARRIQGLADALAAEVQRIAEGSGGRGRARGDGVAARAGHRAAGARGRPDGDLDDEAGPDADEAGPGEGAADEAGGWDPAAPPELEQRAAELKRIYRRLARLLHPDLAADEADRARLTGLMAEINAAYAADDLQALSVLAERLGAGEAPDTLPVVDRLADLARRAAQLAAVATSLRGELARLQRSDTARVVAEAARRRAAGEDYLEARAAELCEEASAARADALARLEGLEPVARALTQARRKIMSELVRTGRTAGGRALRRPFDPLTESAVVRRSAARLEQARAGREARELARWLEAAVAGAPWEAGLTLLAWLAEAGGERPPPSLASAAGFAERWDAARAAWPGAPDLATALGRLPRHLVVGARAGREEVQVGVQLAGEGLAAGVALALGRTSVATLAGELLAGLGPVERCEACRREVRARHLVLTRGLDERHGLACPRCGATLRRYWRYGEAEGLEALWPVALRLGLAAEVTVRLGDRAIAFGQLPEAHAALTAGGVLAAFAALYLEPCGIELPRGALTLLSGRTPLPPRRRVAGAGRLTLSVNQGSGTTAAALVELLRTRVAGRFRPGEG